ncbi:MAG: hypothetical protein VX000_11005, partial [Myxococcota bacterium]|nr:hypothetical protein [Myxococcota bacterium]
MLVGLSMTLLGAGLALGAPPSDGPASAAVGPRDARIDDAAAPAPRSVHVVYTGARDGIGSRYVVPDLFNQVQVSAASGGAVITQVRAVHGVLSQEPWLLRAET